MALHHSPHYIRQLKKGWHDEEEHLTYNRSGLSLNLIKGSRCFLEQFLVTLIHIRADRHLPGISKKLHH